MNPKHKETLRGNRKKRPTNDNKLISGSKKGWDKGRRGREEGEKGEGGGEREKKKPNLHI